MSSCLSADEARKIYQENEVTKISQQILEAASTGVCELRTTRRLSDRARSILKELGYEISEGEKGGVTRISWQ